MNATPPGPTRSIPSSTLAPGTEDDPPRPPWWIDLREALAP